MIIDNPNVSYTCPLSNNTPFNTGIGVEIRCCEWEAKVGDGRERKRERVSNEVGKSRRKLVSRPSGDPATGETI